MSSCYYMRYTGLPLLMLLSSCGFENKAQPDEIGFSKKHYYIAHHKEAPSLDYPNLGRTNLHPGNVSVPYPFSPDTAIQRLFPGNFEIAPAEYSDDVFHVTRWCCPDCETIDFSYSFWSDTDTDLSSFPYSGLNTTVLMGAEKIVLDAVEHQLLIFFHTSLETPEFYGRFAGAPIGLALFKRSKNTYSLTHFAALCGEYGSFSRPTYPILHTSHETVLVEFYVYNGGPGEPYSEIKEFFMPQNGTFKKVLREEFVALVNTDVGEWYTTTSLEADTIPHALKLQTKGLLHGSKFVNDDYRWVYDTAPDAFKSIAQKTIKDQESIFFTLTRTYNYRGSKYTLCETDLSYEVVDSVKEEFKPTWVLY